MSYIDIAVIVIVALFAIIGFAKGFFKTLSSLFGWVLAILLTVLLTKLVAQALIGVDAIGRFAVGDGSGWSFYKWIYSLMPEDIVGIDMGQMQTVLNAGGVEGLQKLLEENSGFWMGIFVPMIINAVVNPVFFASSLANAGQALALQLSYTLYTLCVGVVLFIVIRILLAVIARLLRGPAGKGKGFLGRLGGFFTGIVRGGLYSVMFLALLSWILSFNFGFIAPLKKQVENSVISGKVIELIDNTSDSVNKKVKIEATNKRLIELVGATNGTDDEIEGWRDAIDAAGQTGVEKDAVKVLVLRPASD